MSGFLKVDSFEPDYSKTCDVCGADHVVTAVVDGKTIDIFDMCGVCTWGESAMADPDNWNEG